MRFGGEDIVTIRLATGAQAGELAKLAAELWDSPLQELEELFAGLTNSENAACFLAYQDGVPLGFAQCQLRHDYVEGTRTSPVGYLEGIYVRPRYRRQGTASRLLAACQDWARAKGCAEFASDCELGNDASLRFHLKMGFAEANRIICFTKTL